MVGGRSYNQSQFNRAVSANRQPGSVFKPFVFLAAFERAAEEGWTLTPATLVSDEPTTFDANGTPWSPANYENEYDGEITLSAPFRFAQRLDGASCGTGGSIASPIFGGDCSGTKPKGFPSIVSASSGTRTTSRLPIRFFQHGESEPRPLLRINRGGREILVKATSIKRSRSGYDLSRDQHAQVSRRTGALFSRGFGWTRPAKRHTNDLRTMVVGFRRNAHRVWVASTTIRHGVSGSQASLPIGIALCSARSRPRGRHSMCRRASTLSI